MLIPIWWTVHGLEYGFGAHEYPTSGVFEVEPRSCPGFVYRRSVLLGSTDMSRSEFQLFMEHLSGKYHGDTYHLIAKNCNHFTDDVCMRITGKPIPGWVNRLAKLGKRENSLFYVFLLDAYMVAFEKNVLAVQLGILHDIMASIFPVDVNASLATKNYCIFSFLLILIILKFQVLSATVYYQKVFSLQQLDIYLIIQHILVSLFCSVMLPMTLIPIWI